MSHPKDATKEELIDQLLKFSTTSPHLHTDLLLALLHGRHIQDGAKAIQSLEDSINKNSASNDSLARKVFWLNLIVGVIGAIGVFAALVQAFNWFKH